MKKNPIINYKFFSLTVAFCWSITSYALSFDIPKIINNSNQAINVTNAAKTTYNGATTTSTPLSLSTSQDDNTFASNVLNPMLAGVGATQTATVREGEDFSDIAERYDVGYYELFEANPGVDPDNPQAGTILIVPTQYILPNELKPNTIVINLAEMRLYYQPKVGQKVYIFPVGIGKEDWETPLGVMRIITKTKNPQWFVPDSILKFRRKIGDPLPKVMPAGPENPLGSYALRLSRSDYLIHGTNVSAGVGRRSSAGCIRLYEKDIAELFSLVEIGTTVQIINKPYKAGWINGKLYFEAHMPLLEQRIEMGGDTKPAIDEVEAANKNHAVQVNWQEVTKIAEEHLGIPQRVDEK
jgi:L,D-transpeptidase ErfK/SrfK